MNAAKVRTMEQERHDPAHVAALFDRCAARFQPWSARASFGLLWLWRRQVVDRLIGQRQLARIAVDRFGPDPAQAPEIVDLMSGTGALWPHLLTAMPRARITALDNAPRMQRLAMEHLDLKRWGRIRSLRGDALATDLPDGQADLVVSSFGLSTLSPDQQRALAAEIARILRPGGGFAMIEVSDPKGTPLRPLMRAYLDHLLPLAERVLSKGAQDLSMIGPYTRAFGDCRGFAAALRDAGLKVSFKKHFFGCATSVAGRKPVDPDAPAP